MVSSIHIFLIVHLLLIQGYMNENIYCKEAVESVEKVSSCPTSKEQWDKAASRKKCWNKALKQTCSAPKKFVYHCVINGYGNATLEVCAPERLILGHCTEFNEVGGVIQDQVLSPCSTKFPRCDDYYLSSEAYKYEDCYKIVEAKKLISSTSKNVEHVPSDETIDGDKTFLLILSVGISASAIVVLVIVIVYVKRRKRKRNRWRREEGGSGDRIFSGRTYDKKGDQTEVHENKIPKVFVSDIGSDENSDQQLQNKPCLSSECTNDDSEVLSENQSLIGQVYGIVRMDSGTLALLLPVVVQWQLCASENRYCQEAVDSVVIVDSCPTSKTEWENAALRKNCNRIASKQNCGPVDQFVYHCVINGYRNETLEVCAPSRIIFGHCVEFNVGGGVIQDQRSTPCSDPFPKCDAIYDSWKAYQFPDCYKLVSMGETTSSTTVTIPSTTATTKDESLPVEYLLSIIAAVVFVLLFAVFVAVLLYCKRNQGGTKTKFEESTEDSGHVYGDDVEKTLREDESKTLINSHESDEIHQLDEMQGEQTKNHTTDLTDTGKLHQPVINNSHVSHDITPSKETGLPLH